MTPDEESQILFALFCLYGNIGTAGAQTDTHIEPDSCLVRHHACQPPQSASYCKWDRPTNTVLWKHPRPSFHPSLVPSYHKSGASPLLHVSLITCFLISARAQLWPMRCPHLSSTTLFLRDARGYSDCKHITLHKHVHTRTYKCCYGHLRVT